MEKKSPTKDTKKKKKKAVRVFDYSHADRRAIPVIRVAPGETDLAIHVRNSDRSQPCMAAGDSTTDLQSVSSSRTDVSSRGSTDATTTTPLEVARRRSRTGGRKSYWRRRIEQFDRENENDDDEMPTIGTDVTRENGLQPPGDIAAGPPPRRPPKMFQEGCIAALPLTIQVGFRRKMFAVFALQLMFISSLMALLTYENELSSSMQSAFKPSGWYILATLAVMVAFLVLLYMGHASFPLNWVILALFSVALGVFFVSMQVYLNTNAGLFCCGFTFLTVTIMIPLSGIERRTTDENGGSDLQLLSTTKAGLAAYAVVLVGSVVLYAVFGTRFVTSGSAFCLSLVPEFALIMWFSYDAPTMYAIMSPDEYMSGVIFFYTDLLAVIVIVIVCGALALLFSSAGMGASGFGGSCDCFGCFRLGRFGGHADGALNNTESVVPDTGPAPALESRRESYIQTPVKVDASMRTYCHVHYGLSASGMMVVERKETAHADDDGAGAAAVVKEDGWRLVTRGASKRKSKKSNGSGSTRAASASSFSYTIRGGASRLDDAQVDGRVSMERQSAIQSRVAQIVLALRGNPLVNEAVGVIETHFGLHPKDESQSASGAVGAAAVVNLVSYGLGSFCSSANAIYQLAYAKALADALNASTNTAQSSFEIFDPVMNEVQIYANRHVCLAQSDIAIAAHFGFRTIGVNEGGKRAVGVPTVFFMPHCGKMLYENVVASNWDAAALPHVVIIGNSFEAYSDRLIAATDRQSSALVGVLPYLSEVPLQSGLPKTHDEHAQYEAAFNDLSLVFADEDDRHDGARR
ncbi:Protein kinase, partial [Globisporangium splendens]